MIPQTEQSMRQRGRGKQNRVEESVIGRQYSTDEGTMGQVEKTEEVISGTGRRTEEGGTAEQVAGPSRGQGGRKSWGPRYRQTEESR